MIILLSPAKTLDFESPSPTKKNTIPEFLEHSQTLVQILKKLSPTKLSKLMDISPKLAELNVARFASWKIPLSTKEAKQAIFAFQGDVYQGLQAETFQIKDLDFAQKHLRILSGLYGLLRPLDLILPYRLEMGTSLSNPKGKDLYAFWGTLLTETLNQSLKTMKKPLLINLASQEYFQSVHFDEIQAEIITPVFKEKKGGQYKIISFYAKKARGLMSAYLIKNRFTKKNDLKSFEIEGYIYNPKLSSDLEWVFTRENPPSEKNGMALRETNA